MFLNPLLLAGSALVVVPIVLHLIMRQRPRRLEFPSLRFVRQAQQLNRRTLQLRHWLLLLLRMGLIALLALALARPSWQTSGWLGSQDEPVAAALIFDTRPHLDYRQQNRTRLEVAREHAAWILGQLPADSQVALIDGSTIEAAFQIDLGAARQRLDKLATNGAAHGLVESLRVALALLRERTEPREIYLFTDLARSSWTAESTTLLADFAADWSRTGLYLIDVGVTDPQNASLGTLRLSSQILPQNGPLNLSTEVSSQGLSGGRSIEAFVLNESGVAEPRGATTVELTPGESIGIELVLGSLAAGTRQGFVRIQGADGLAADDERYFTVEVRPPWRVLIAAPAPAAEQGFFFQQAIAPEAFRKNGQARFDVTVVPYDQLSAQSFEAFAAIVLLDPPSLGDALWNRLGTFVLTGGGVALALGDNAQDRAGFLAAAAGEWLPGKLGSIARFPEQDVYLTTAGNNHPLWNKFLPLGDSIPWENFPVLRYWRLAELAAGANVIATYNDGKPAVVERVVGAGRVVLLTTPLSEPPRARDEQRWNWLPTGFEPWPFVMLANELTLYLVGSQDERLNFPVGEAAVLKLDPARRPSQYVLHTPRGEHVARHTDPGQPALVETTTDVPGNYQIAAGSQESGLRRGFSVNLSPESTQLARLEPAELQELLAPVRFQLARDREQIERSVSSHREGEELFPLLIVVLAFILGAEQLLANRFYREPRSA